MTTIVIDASALAAILFQEPEGVAIALRLAGASLAAPHLLDFELANICVSKSRKSPSDAAALFAGLEMRSRLLIDLHDVDAEEVVGLALETKLTAYDASYLWLARRLDAELVTLDKALARAVAAT